MPLNRKYKKLPVIALGFLILISYPIVSAVNKPVLIKGIPVLMIYLFFVWGLVILLTYLSFRKNG